MGAPGTLAKAARQPQFPSMNTTVSKNLVMLARMLERLERSVEPVDPQQYRAVVEHLTEVMRCVPDEAALEAVLHVSPAAAELYENMHYQHAGLCRSPLDLALGAELAARDVIEAARRDSRQPKR